MNKKKILSGLLALQASINQIIDAFENEGEATETSAPEKKASSTKQTTAKSEETLPKSTSTNANVTAETLSKMSYNDIKSLCKKLGVSPVGNRTELETRLLGTSAPNEEDTSEDTAKEIAEAIDTLSEDDTHAKILALTEEMSNEEIADILAEVGISPKGKREILITKLEKAVEDGLLSLDDDEEAKEEEKPTKKNSKASEKSDSKTKEKEAPKKSKKEPEPVEETDDDDDVNDFENNADITDERAEACQAYHDEVEEAVDKGEVERSEMETFIKDFYGEDEDLSEVSDEDIVETYIDLSIRYIDDDGDMVEEDSNAYMLNGAVACCGRHCIQSEDTGKYICEKCGEEYEVEE